MPPRAGSNGTGSTARAAARRVPGGASGTGGGRRSGRAAGSGGSPAGAPDAPATDLRKLRGVQTRQQIAEALIALLEEGAPVPPARQVAQRAGVSTRLVYHHFADMEAVFEEAAMLQGRRHWSRLTDLDPSLPLATRITRIAAQRRRLFEAVAPVRRAAAGRVGGSKVLAAAVALSHQRLRTQLATSFAPELERAGTNAPTVLDALDAAGSWECWDFLRAGGHRSPARAEAVVRHVMTTELAPS